MSDWQKLAPLAGCNNPCLHCPPIGPKLDPERVIAVGFGDAHVSRDGDCVWREPQHYETQKDCVACGSLGIVDKNADGNDVLCGQCGGLGSVDDSDAEPREYWQTKDAEAVAALDPDHDWRIVLYGRCTARSTSGTDPTSGTLSRKTKASHDPHRPTGAEQPMRYYRCKCGKREAWGSYSPNSCQGCPDCKTTLAETATGHETPSPHDWREEWTIDRKTGERGKRRSCARCLESEVVEFTFTVNGTPFLVRPADVTVGQIRAIANVAPKLPLFRVGNATPLDDFAVIRLDGEAAFEFGDRATVEKP